MSVSNTHVSTLGINNGLDLISFPETNVEDVSSVKTNGDNKFYLPKDLDSSLYSSSPERNGSSESQQVTQHSDIATTPKKTAKIDDVNVFSRGLSSIKDFFFGKAIKNDDTINEALTVLINDAVTDEKASQALDHLVKKASSDGGFFRFLGKDVFGFLDKEHQRINNNKKVIGNFCSNLIKDINDI
jgi:hypothetical protein